MLACTCSRCHWPSVTLQRRLRPPMHCRAEEEADFKEYAAKPDVFGDIAGRIAPQIFGHKEIKQAVACLLFGGARKVRGRHVPDS